MEYDMNGASPHKKGSGGKHVAARGDGTTTGLSERAEITESNLALGLDRKKGSKNQMPAGSKQSVSTDRGNFKFC